MSDLHQAYLNFSSRKGDRIGNILKALQYLQIKASIVKMSSFFEATSHGDQNKVLNRVCLLKTELQAQELFHYLKWIEERICNGKASDDNTGAIEMDLLLFDDLVLDSKELTIPHPGLQNTVSMLTPLAEIAPELAVHPLSEVTVEQMLRELDSSGLKKVDHGTLNLAQDAQQAKPSISMSLSRVGVTNISRIIFISSKGSVIPFQAELELFADLDSHQAGVHMSRFSDDLEEIVQKFSSEPSPDIESLAEQLARQMLKSQKAVYSEVHIRGRTALRKTTPLSGKDVHEVFTLIGIAAATKGEVRRLVGVETEGVTACPCAQGMMRNHYHHVLQSEGFSKDQADHILKVLPAPSHNQRGRGTLIIGSEERVQAEQLVKIVEASMSSEIYELLKRPDEFFVVNKTHQNPKFVEDVVREMLRNVVDILSSLPDPSFILAKQINFEGIHRHDAYAERYGLLGEIRREMRDGRPIARHITLQDWLRS